MSKIGFVALLFVSIFPCVAIGQRNSTKLPEFSASNEVVKRSPKSVPERTTLKAIIIQMDRLSRNAAKDLSNAKSTADRQDAVQSNREKIEEFAASQSGKTIEFSVKVKDVVTDEFNDAYKSTFANTFGVKTDDVSIESSLMVVTSLPKELAPFIGLRTPLQCSGYLSFQIDEEDKPRFTPSKTVILKGEIITSTNHQLLDGSIIKPIHLFTFNLDHTNSKVGGMGSGQLNNDNRISFWLADVTYPDALTPTDPKVVK